MGLFALKKSLTLGWGQGFPSNGFLRVFSDDVGPRNNEFVKDGSFYIRLHSFLSSSHFTFTVGNFIAHKRAFNAPHTTFKNS